jgi:MFS family permease
MDSKIRKSLRYSTLDGIFASIMQGFSENFVTPYALAMKATVAQIGLLVSLPNLLGSLVQLGSASVIDRLGSRMALITPCVLLHTLVWLPMIFIPYLAVENGTLWFILFLTLFTLLNAFDMPAWSSLMADYVPENERGSFFGWRNRLLGFINVAAALVAGLILNRFTNSTFLGFTIIFSIAFVSRFISWNFLRKMCDLPLVIREEHKFTFRQFLKRLKVSNFGRFVIFISAMNFSVAIVSPFLAVYMLSDLEFDYVTYTVVQLAATIPMLGATRMWGIHADHVGNRRVLRLTSFFVTMVPLMWALSRNVMYLIAIQVIAGFFWSGFNLSMANFILDAVTPEKRPRCIAYFNVMNGSAICFGALTGGYIVKWMPPVFGYKILALALLSFVLRAFVTGLFARVREVRAVKDVSNLELFYSVIGLRPILPGGSRE